MDRFTSRRGVLCGGLALGVGAFLPGAVFAQSGHRGDTRLADFPVADNGEVLDQIRHVATAERVIAMTFDDGPHQILTPQVLGILAARQIKASFFVVGNRVAQMPALVARIAQEGHEIGNHSWSHPHMSRMPDHAVLNQIDKTADTVVAATGHRPVLIRPPYGDFSLRQSRMMRMARNMPTIMWSVDPQDWRRPGGFAIADHIIRHAEPGAVVLAHDTVNDTIRNLPHALDTLLAQGYRFVTVSELIGFPAWMERQGARAT
jgi:peptidoglycan/xylan/chitin deacetylase (PgdA/CDA1 family)